MSEVPVAPIIAPRAGRNEKSPDRGLAPSSASIRSVREAAGPMGCERFAAPTLKYDLASATYPFRSFGTEPFALSYKIEMNGPKHTGFADRLSVAADAKKALLERAARARSAADSPAAIERRAAREAARVARDARIAERKAAKLAIETQRAAALATQQAAEAAAREAALKAEEEAREAEFAERVAREAEEEAVRQEARDARYAARKARKRKGR